MAVIPSQVPQRLPAGMTSDAPFQPWADCGAGDPSFYHTFFDDFDFTLGATGLYTVSKGSTGTAVHTAGDGGLAILTTAATLNDYVSIQLPAADFTLPQGALAGKKLFYQARLQLSDVNLSQLVAGLVDTTATIFTAITDGIWFSKASGSSQLVLNIASGGATVSYNVPIAAYSLANATNLDFAFSIDRYGNVLFGVGAQMFGFIPQSGTGANTPAGSYPSGRTVYPSGKVYSGNQPGTVATGYTLTAANLNPTLGIKAGAAVAKSVTIDFHGVAKER
jgi:hypothetical protein